MAVGMLLAGEAVTAETYRQLTEAMFGTYPMREDQSPDGLVVHTAGTTAQGFYVYDIWESQEHFERFVADKLGPAIEQLGVDEAGRPAPEFYPIEVMVQGPAL